MAALLLYFVLIPLLLVSSLADNSVSSAGCTASNWICQLGLAGAMASWCSQIVGSTVYCTPDCAVGPSSSMATCASCVANLYAMSQYCEWVGSQTSNATLPPEVQAATTSFASMQKTSGPVVTTMFRLSTAYVTAPASPRAAPVGSTCQASTSSLRGTSARQSVMPAASSSIATLAPAPTMPVVFATTTSCLP